MNSTQPVGNAAVSARFSTESGFTLIELLVVILVLGILAAVALPSFLHQTTKAEDAAFKTTGKPAHTLMTACWAESSGDFRKCAPAGSYADTNRILLDNGIGGGEGADDEIFIDQVTKLAYRLNGYAGKRKRLFRVYVDHSTAPVTYTLSCEGDGCPTTGPFAPPTP